MTSHIVVVDDEPITLKQLRRILEKEGHRVSAFSNPRRALEHLERDEAGRIKQAAPSGGRGCWCFRVSLWAYANTNAPHRQRLRLLLELALVFSIRLMTTAA